MFHFLLLYTPINSALDIILAALDNPCTLALLVLLHVDICVNLLSVLLPRGFGEIVLWLLVGTVASDLQAGWVAAVEPLVKGKGAGGRVEMTQ